MALIGRGDGGMGEEDKTARYERAAWLWAFSKACELGDREGAGALAAKAVGLASGFGEDELKMANASLEWCARRGWVKEGGMCVKLGANHGLGALRRIHDSLECVPGFPGVVEEASWTRAGDFCEALREWGLAIDPARVAQEGSRWLQSNPDPAAWSKVLGLGLAPEELVWAGKEGTAAWLDGLGDLTIVGACLAVGRADFSRPWESPKRGPGSPERIALRLEALALAGADMEKASTLDDGRWLGGFGTAVCHGSAWALSTEVLDALERLGADPTSPTPLGPTPCWLLADMRRFEGGDDSSEAREHANRLASWFASRGEDFNLPQARGAELGKSGMTPLFVAIDTQQWAWAQALAGCGADPRRGWFVGGQSRMDCMELLRELVGRGPERCPPHAGALLAQFEAQEIDSAASLGSSSPRARL